MKVLTKLSDLSSQKPTGKKIILEILIAGGVVFFWPLSLLVVALRKQTPPQNAVVAPASNGLDSGGDFLLAPFLLALFFVVAGPEVIPIALAFAGNAYIWWNLLNWLL